LGREVKSTNSDTTIAAREGQVKNGKGCLKKKKYFQESKENRQYQERPSLSRVSKRVRYGFFGAPVTRVGSERGGNPWGKKGRLIPI